MSYQLAVSVASGSSAMVFNLAETATGEEVVTVLSALKEVLGHRLPPEKHNLLASLIGPDSPLTPVKAKKPSAPPSSSPTTSPSRQSAVSEKQKKTKLKKKLHTSAEVRLSDYVRTVSHGKRIKSLFKRFYVRIVASNWQGRPSNATRF